MVCEPLMPWFRPKRFQPLCREMNPSTSSQAGFSTTTTQTQTRTTSMGGRCNVAADPTSGCLVTPSVIHTWLDDLYASRNTGATSRVSALAGRTHQHSPHHTETVAVTINPFLRLLSAHMPSVAKLASFGRAVQLELCNVLLVLGRSCDSEQSWTHIPSFAIATKGFSHSFILALLVLFVHISLF
jgi:hypothetical protein